MPTNTQPPDASDLRSVDDGPAWPIEGQLSGSGLPAGPVRGGFTAWFRRDLLGARYAEGESAVWFVFPAVRGSYTGFAFAIFGEVIAFALVALPLVPRLPTSSSGGGTARPDYRLLLLVLVVPTWLGAWLGVAAHAALRRLVCGAAAIASVEPPPPSPAEVDAAEAERTSEQRWAARLGRKGAFLWGRRGRRRGRPPPWASAVVRWTFGASGA